MKSTKNAAAKGGRPVWITTEQGTRNSRYLLFSRHPKSLRSSVLYYPMCPRKFTRITGFALKPGEVKKVRIQIKVIR